MYLGVYLILSGYVIGLLVYWFVSLLINCLIYTKYNTI